MGEDWNECLQLEGAGRTRRNKKEQEETEKNGLILGAGGDIYFGQRGQNVFQFFFAGQLCRKDGNVPALATPPSAVTLLGVESQICVELPGS